MDGIAEKGKSPFVLTFIIVWVLHHWELVYLMLNFGADYTAFQKLDFVQERLKDETFCDLLVYPLLYSIASYIGYLFISLLFELVYAGYKWGRAFVKLWSKDPKVIDINKYKLLEMELSKKATSIETLNKQVNALSLFQTEYRHYKTDLLKPIAYLLFKTMASNEAHKFYEPEILTTLPLFMNGDWKVTSPNSPSFNLSGQIEKYAIRSNQFVNLKNEPVGLITDIQYESNNGLLSLEFESIPNRFKRYYILIVISNEELIGFLTNQGNRTFVHFEKINP